MEALCTVQHSTVQYSTKLHNCMICLVFSASSWPVPRQESDVQISIKHNKHQLYTSSSNRFNVKATSCITFR